MRTVSTCSVFFGSRSGAMRSPMGQPGKLHAPIYLFMAQVPVGCAGPLLLLTYYELALMLIAASLPCC